MVAISRAALVSIARMGSPSSILSFYLMWEFIIGASLTVLFGLLALVRSFIPKPPRDLTGNVVLVTGATSKLGRSIADEFAQNGCTIIRVNGVKGMKDSGTNELSSHLVLEEPNEEEEPSTNRHDCDLWNAKAISKLADRIEREIGGIDVLVTCAGHNAQDIFDTVHVTLMSHYWTVLAFLPSMLKRERAHVVGVIPTSNPEDAYAGSKAAIAGLMESLGQELGGHGARLNFITVASQVDHRSDGQSERFIARDIVRAVKRNRCTLRENWWTTILERISYPIRGVITMAARWLYPGGCEYSR